jgi:hypothetical protein
MFLTDFILRLPDLINTLQDYGKTTDVISNNIKNFDIKLKIFKHVAYNGTFKLFKDLQKNVTAIEIHRGYRHSEP